MADLEKKDVQLEEAESEKEEKTVETKDKKEKSKKAAPKKNKVKLGQRIKKFFKDYKSELKKIVWCSKKQTLQYTLYVLIAIVIVAAFIGLLDLAFSQLLMLLGGLI